MSDARLSDFDVKMYADTCDLMPPRAPVGIPAESLAMLLAEIRLLRSRQLSAADREALEFVALDIRGQAPIDNSGYVCGKWRAALVTIDRLLVTAEDE